MSGGAWLPSSEPAIFLLGAHMAEGAGTSLRSLLVHGQLLSRVQLFMTPWTVAHQAPVHGIFQAKILE